MTLLGRPRLRAAIEDGLRRAPVVSVLGPRQSGKTTLARQVAADRPGTFFDLEDPRAAERLRHPAAALEPLEGLVVIERSSKC